MVLVDSKQQLADGSDSLGDLATGGLVEPVGPRQRGLAQLSCC